MGERLFYRSYGSDSFSYDPHISGGSIVVKSTMYDPKALNHRSVEITLDANEWDALKKYASDIGGDFS